ncbi:hypothetical protein Pan44_51800 [Caulifigura coniformis]|uniref:DUF4239 domain-containing protein n=1 Tax=Caulifigura coniformis TaxID=2527983 RepID=A0A517SLW4_9PLAN|nr:hypothetical protein [Caulifigura coniformis]QDT57114.1 hypothetical protein Pan44_51800 [Caulifigura coniformis]
MALERVYDLSPSILAIVVLAMLAFTNEIGFRIGRLRSARESEPARAVSGAMKATILGLVALLLGFSYSITSSKFSQRQRLVLDEANAIGTCDLRAQLLPPPARERIRVALRGYTDARIAYFEQALEPDAASKASSSMNAALEDLWAGVGEAFQANSDLTKSSEIIPAANEVIDLSSTRSWASRNHMPPSMVVLLIVCLAISGSLTGHSSGQSGSRHTALWTTLNVLVALILFVVLDFDRPRRGLIQVDHRPLLELQSSLVPADPQR